MVLDIKNIVKRYKDVVALNDFSLHMENGLYGFLGENGAGKSTLIKILSCNLVQDEGVILADGKDIRLAPEEYRKRISYMPGVSRVSRYESTGIYGVYGCPKGVVVKRTFGERADITLTETGAFRGTYEKEIFTAFGWYETEAVVCTGCSRKSIIAYS